MDKNIENNKKTLKLSPLSSPSAVFTHIRGKNIVRTAQEIIMMKNRKKSHFNWNGTKIYPQPDRSSKMIRRNASGGEIESESIP
jgi:hypothetical protein